MLKFQSRFGHFISHIFLCANVLNTQVWLCLRFYFVGGDSSVDSTFNFVGQFPVGRLVSDRCCCIVSACNLFICLSFFVDSSESSRDRGGAQSTTAHFFASDLDLQAFDSLTEVSGHHIVAKFCTLLVQMLKTCCAALEGWEGSDNFLWT